MPPDDITTSESEAEIIKRNVSRGKSVEGGYQCSFPGCNLRFKRQVKLDRHEFGHTGLRKYMCTFEGCNKSYTITTHLKRHIKTVHENIRPVENVQCLVDTCTKAFSCVYHMERHMRDAHENPKIYPCPNCSSKFKRKMQLRRHIVTHTGVYPFKCDKCQKGFILKSLFERHSCNPKTYKCDSCEEEFQKWSSLVAHRKAEHMSCYKCDQCGKEFKRKQYLKIHLENHKDAEEREALICPWKDCDRTYYHAINLKTHIRSKHEGYKYKCPYQDCNKELASRQKLAYHARLHEIGPGMPKEKKPKTVKVERSDKGKKKVSYASALAGVILNPETEKIILSGQGKEIDVEAPDTSEVTDTDDDVPLAKRVQLLTQLS